MSSLAAIQHIVDAERCDEGKAIGQLVTAIIHRKVGMRLCDPKRGGRPVFFPPGIENYPKRKTGLAVPKIVYPGTDIPFVLPPDIEKGPLFASIGPGGGPMVSPGTRQVPTPDMWRTAGIRMTDGAVRFRYFPKVRWYGFDVLREQVLRIWPAQRRSTTAAERKALDWLVRDLKDRGTDAVSKSERRKIAISKFGISERAFDDRIWPEAIRTAGLDKASNPGRKRKSPQ
jgi:hypothetical protein